MKKIKRAYIEISNLCNVQCSFCPVVERDNKIMGLTDFSKIIKEVKHRAEEICLHLMGEPLAHPKIADILDICHKEDVKVQLTTNGILINRYHDLLVNSPCLRQINFSLQSYQDNFPDRDLSQYLKPILGFTLALEKVRPEVYINLRLWNLLDDRLDNEEIFSVVEKFYDIQIKRKTEIGNIKSKRIYNKVYLHFDTRFEWPSFDNEFQGEKGRCHGMINQIGIHADGTVVPCCLDKEAQINLGNCLEESLDTILESPRAMKIKTGFQNNKRVEPLCQHCSFSNRFIKN